MLGWAVLDVWVVHNLRISSGIRAPTSVTSAAGWIAYQGPSGNGPDGIFVVRPDGTEDHEILLDVSGRRLHPDFSPDGSMLAFDQSDGDVDNLYVAAANHSNPMLMGIAIVDVATGALTQIVEHSPADGQDHFPRWSPDGSHLVF